MSRDCLTGRSFAGPSRVTEGVQRRAPRLSHMEVYAAIALHTCTAFTRLFIAASLGRLRPAELLTVASSGSCASLMTGGCEGIGCAGALSNALGDVVRSANCCCNCPVNTSACQKASECQPCDGALRNAGQNDCQCCN